MVINIMGFVPKYGTGFAIYIINILKDLFSSFFPFLNKGCFAKSSLFKF